MRKSTKKPQGKDGRFFSLITKIVKGLSLIMILIAFMIVVIVVIYGIKEKARIEINFVKGWPSVTVTPQNITTEGDVKLYTLQHDVDQEMVSKHRYELEIGKRERIQKAFQEFKEKAVEVSRLPKELQGTPDEVVAKIAITWEEMQNQCNSIWYSCYMISTEIARVVSIDTNVGVNDEHRKEVYRCVQLCLNKIGYYKGDFDGDQGRTNAAVVNFQNQNGVDPDGKVGRQTWRAMLIILAQEIHGKMPKPLSYSRL